MSSANHNHAIKSVVGERNIVDITLLSANFFAKFFFGISEFSGGIIKNPNFFSAIKILFGEATIATSDINEFV